MARPVGTIIKQERGLPPRPGANIGSSREVIMETASEHEAALQRQARSAAPSVSDTRPRAPSTRPPPSTIAYEEPEYDDDSDIEFLEVRPTILKAEPGAEHAIPHFASMTTQSMQGSFIGPNNALKDFGHALKDINDALGELQARGIQHVVNLPELVLVGDQSSGKSSLMSALAGLSLPRSTGTCTRCPIHIRISKADEWSCRVFLNQQYEYRPPNHPITEADVTPSNKFPPWVRSDPSRSKRVEFKTIQHRFDSEEIETVLRCAQLAILNPSTLYQAFIPKPRAGEGSDGSRLVLPDMAARKEESSEAQFSPNTVALEIKGPDLADLNFYDLPGVFNTARRREDSYLERVVQNLTSEYIARPNAIILWAVPMNLDTENSLALRLIRQSRADHRCVGVITKADLLPNDGEAVQRWRQILLENPKLTGLGFYITSRQGSDLDEQIKREEAFFNRTADATGHWPVAFDQFKETCGVEKLKGYLSNKLGQEFAKVLPEVKQKVYSRLQTITGQLKLYPDPPLNPEMEIMRSLRDFSDAVKVRITQRHFNSAWHGRCAEAFRQSILSLKPKYNVKEHAKGVSMSRPVFIDLENGSPGGPSPTPTPRKRPAPSETPSHRRQRIKAEDSNGTVFPSTPTHLRNGNAISINGTPSQTPSRGLLNRSRTLMDIRVMIQRNAIPGQPGLVSPEIYEPLYTEAVQTWEVPLKAFIRETFNFLQVEILQILDGAFRGMKNRAIYNESLQYMQEFIDEHRKALQSQLNLIYNLESHSLFTLDATSLERYKSEELKLLTRHRNHYRIAAHNGDDIRPPPKMEDLTDDDLAQEAAKMAKELRNLGPEQFEQELNVAAYTRAHYLVAAHRFADYACIHVMSGLLPRVNDVIGTYLPEKLGLAHSGTTPEIIARLMEEEPEIGQKRRDLRAEKVTLDDAMDIIVNLENRERQAASQYDATQSADAGDAAGRGHESPLSDRTRRYSLTAYGDA